MRGRKPKPIAVHVKNGNPSKLNLTKAKAAAPRPPDSTGQPPTWLTREARAAWCKLFPVLSQMRVMSGADEEALAQLCEHLADAQRYSKRLAKMRKEKTDGDLVVLPSGYVMMHPFVSRKDASSEKALKYMVEFGLTPSSRNRVKVAGDEEDDLLGFVARMN